MTVEFSLQHQVGKKICISNKCVIVFALKVLYNLVVATSMKRKETPL